MSSFPPCALAHNPIVGKGEGAMSFIHLEDAAAATVLALEQDGSGIYNIVDDEPAPLRVWLPELAKVLGAKPPQRYPRQATARQTDELAGVTS